MGRNEQRLEAGLVYLMATVLQHYHSHHPSISEAVKWLNDHNCVREANKLSRSMSKPAKTMETAT